MKEQCTSSIYYVKHKCLVLDLLNSRKLANIPEMKCLRNIVGVTFRDTVGSERCVVGLEWKGSWQAEWTRECCAGLATWKK